MRLKYDYSVIPVMLNSLEAIIKSIYSYLMKFDYSMRSLPMSMSSRHIRHRLTGVLSACSCDVYVWFEHWGKK